MTPAELREKAAEADAAIRLSDGDVLRAAANTIEALQRREAEWDGYDEMHAKLTAKIAEKDAEIERLNKTVQSYQDKAIEQKQDAEILDASLVDCNAERDRLRAEVARLNGTMPAEVEKKLRAEVERLKTEVLGWITSVNELAELAGAEPGDNNVEVIRAALEDR